MINNNLTVLYVEDDDVVRENFKEIFEDYFFNVIVADNGKTALELFITHKPDIAILDISLPLLSGLQVATKIRESNNQTEIIMLTAYSDQEKLLQAVNLQLFAYLVKPVQQKELDKTIQNILNKFENNNIINLINNFTYDKGKEELFYKNKNIRLTNNERLIINLFINNLNQYFKAPDIAAEILEDNNDINGNNVVQIISRFKHKILKSFDIDDFFIENSYGAGYRIITT